MARGHGLHRPTQGKGGRLEMEMKHFALACLIAGNVFGVESRTLWNGLSPGVKWETDKSVAVKSESGAVEFRCDGDYGWATTEDSWPVTVETQVELETQGKV